MVIRMRHTRSHTKNRRSHHALKQPALSKCQDCDALTRPHHMCLECGFYKGRQVLDIEAQKAKREARMQAKRERISAEAGTEQAEADAATQGTETTTEAVATADEKKEA
ncbi:MAG: 50S ribosomal protein L32 [Candidatus Pacebacteria bacterium]|nr:50S ribosomal protein L32 [Candidatus Paceibacterota bacterium]